MVFSSLEFIFRFLPLFLGIYYITPKRYRNIILLIGSIGFYTLGEPTYIFLLLTSIVANFIFANRMNKTDSTPSSRKFWLILALVYDLGMLFFFKYINFLIENINILLKAVLHTNLSIAAVSVALPLGISFYTFQIISYIIDVYRGNIKTEKNIFLLALYLSMFPQLISGPLISYSEILKQIKGRKYSLYKVEKGLKLFTIGLGFKVLIANRIGILWNDIQTIGFESISTPLAWLGAYGYSLQLYFDFHGYTLMAIGVGKMLGFSLPNNFAHPYMSKSVSEFWRRWHMTLGKWFKDYVYIPLGGNRRGKGRLAFNLFVVWTLTGLWHGANWTYIIWGFSLFVFILMEKLFLKQWLDRTKVLARLYILVVMPLTWVVFAIPNLAEVGIYFGRLFGFHPGINVNSFDFIKYILQYKWLFLLGIFFSMPYALRWFVKHERSILVTVLLFLVFWMSVYQLAIGANNPFMYFKF